MSTNYVFVFRDAAVSELVEVVAFNMKIFVMDNQLQKYVRIATEPPPNFNLALNNIKTGY